MRASVDGASLCRSGGLGHRSRSGGGPWRAQCPGDGAGTYGTISFLMDCDTTGVEPDLGLVKTKKLVGGGTMSIVNQTVPRALKRLGYSTDEIDQIVAYIDEHKTILGAPDLQVAHLPVFACSMGDNTIHYLGHVKMMAAAQPFISGAISKTVNLPSRPRSKKSSNCTSTPGKWA